MRRQDARPRSSPPWAPAEGAGVAPSTERRNPSGAARDTSCGRSTMGRWGSPCFAGPAHAGKVALLLERYLARLDDEPVLIVPNRSDVDRVERDLLARCGCLLGGSIGTFDDLFARLAAGDPGWRRVAGEAERSLVVRRALAGVSLDGLAGSARTAGFTDSLLRTLGELESGLLDPERRRRRARRPLRGVPGRARTARPLGPRHRAPARGRAAAERPRAPGTASRSSPTASRT